MIEAICAGGLEGTEHISVCQAVAELLGTWQPIHGAGFVAPFCENICWHSCKGESYVGGADDGFLECPSESCAHDSCIDFLLRECPPVQHAELTRLYDAACTMAPPSPPRPPGAPPPRVLDAAAAALAAAGALRQLRERATETDYDPNCTLVTYETCRGVVADFARQYGSADVLKVSAGTAPCEGLADEGDCFIGCQIGAAGSNGGHYRFLLPDMEAEFSTKNFYRCKYASQPFCVCGGSAPPPPLLAPPPPIAFAEDYVQTTPYRDNEATLGGAELTHHPERGVASALIKRLANARTIDLALRASHLTVQCAADDGSSTCGRYCAAEHLTMLRAFTVTGVRHQAANAPPPNPPPRPPPPPPLPPSLPFTECANTCSELGNALLAEGDTVCRDGGYGAFLPTVCPFATHCSACGFRSNTQTIVQDDSCASANNGVCEDGGTGSAFVASALYVDALTHLCGLGTDAADCAGLGDRLAQAPDRDAFQGVTNFSRPLPPPPMPPPPLPSTPPPSAFDPCTDTCTALFVVTEDAYGNSEVTFDCSGTADQIDAKRAAGLCASAQPSGSIPLCSDGGFGAHAIRAHGNPLTNDADQTEFGCDFGTSCSSCSRRAGGATTDYECAAQQQDDRAIGECLDTCWVDVNGGVHNVEERFDDEAATADVVDKRCHDGGPGSVSAKCGFGTQGTRCGIRTVAYQSIHHGLFNRRRLNFDGSTTSIALLAPPPRPPPPPPPSPAPNAAVTAVIGTDEIVTGVAAAVAAVAAPSAAAVAAAALAAAARSAGLLRRVLVQLLRVLLRRRAGVGHCAARARHERRAVGRLVRRARRAHARPARL